ncbi:hypothetical protein OIU79_024066 [Salix purpurea]|uniref:Uncharacterized protein n=1 Tax=Salix purpurea TaxID=77065 RepID=A0A9Q1A9M6_SALPP|nr:hypothetical protein OIU79_024066 [Salix purpurea]
MVPVHHLLLKMVPVVYHVDLENGSSLVRCEIPPNLPSRFRPQHHDEYFSLI